MGIFSGFSNIFSSRGKAMSLYERAMRSAKNDSFEVAIKDYTAALELKKIPTDIKAMALFNRGLAFAAVKNEERAKTDLEAVVDMSGAPINVVTAAREKLERMRRRARE